VVGVFGGNSHQKHPDREGEERLKNNLKKFQVAFLI
jgi:hypothetical protein